MRAVTHDTFGDPAEVLRQSDRPIPQPGPRQVRLKVILSPVHNHDLSTVRGQYGYRPELPAIGGTEAVGIIDAVGEGLDAGMAGRRVAVGGIHGSWAEYVLASATGLVPVPDTIPDESAAQLVAMPFSAITLLDHLDVSSGDWIIQNAANGAVGRMLSRLAAARGVNCVSLVRRADGVAELQASGIANAVSTAENGWQDRVREITAGAAIRVGVDSVGGTASGDLAALIGDNGRMVVFGSMTAQPVVIPPGEFIFRNLTLRGFWGSSVMARLPQERRAALMGEVIGRVMSGDLPLPVDGIFGLDRPADAVRASLTPGKVGKVMFRP
ncbi:zinc-binding dehydrogenase [Paracoccus aeridis]|uniref:zinc-binding dehydrogenase n=1 Tax=Paracoccus aeridis TaxID=1966466 RepID=UPI0010AAD89B|nr:zinc-binding dehydrogenase [Paracoccus aeridis]